MDLIPLGRTGLVVSRLGLGTVKLGRNAGLKYPNGEGVPLPTDDQAITLLQAAADLGINLLDTAPAYGTSEDRLGALMNRHNWLGGRDRWVVCTKVGEEFTPPTTTNPRGESTFDFSPQHVRTSVERSLRRLKTDVLDIVLIHSDGRDQWIIDESGALDELRVMQRQGLVRAVGMSVKTLDGALQAVRSAAGYGGQCDVIMLEHSPAHRESTLAIDAASLRGVGVLIKKALGSGHLDSLWAKTPAEFKAQSAGPVEAALRFTLNKPGPKPHSIILGTASPEHLKQNAEAYVRAVSLRAQSASEE